MGSRPSGRVALMSIHPQYANAILDGSKTVEFRKRGLAPDVRTVLVYATSPIQRVIGEFEVERIVQTSPDDLWREAGPLGGIDEETFRNYYGTGDKAAGIVVAEARRYLEAVELARLDPDVRAPQSFAYLSQESAVKARELAGGTRSVAPVHKLLERLSFLMRQLPVPAWVRD